MIKSDLSEFGKCTHLSICVVLAHRALVAATLAVQAFDITVHFEVALEAGEFRTSVRTHLTHVLHHVLRILLRKIVLQLPMLQQQFVTGGFVLAQIAIFDLVFDRMREFMAMQTGQTDRFVIAGVALVNLQIRIVAMHFIVFVQVTFAFRFE